MSAIDVTFRIGGEAGQGVESSGDGFCKALVRGGFRVFAVSNYYSRIRGGHNYFTIRVSDEAVFAIRETIHVLVALDAESIKRHSDALVPGGAIVVDKDLAFDPSSLLGRDVRLLKLPLAEIAKKHGNEVMVNTAALAVAAALVEFDLEFMASVIVDNFGKKSSAIAQANQDVAHEAYALVEGGGFTPFPWKISARSAPQRLAITGNQAFAMGALMAGCKFVAGYPMTPASSVLEYFAKHGAHWGLVMKHAEDEIAAINMVIGAAHAGVRAMTSTSGGGFDLMTEGLSLAGMTETPVVVYLAQRPGPATGLATRTAQADLSLALYSSHGEFPRVVLAPHTPLEAFQCAARAFDIAEKYQCVVIVLSDQYNATAVWSVDADQFDAGILHRIDRGKLLTAPELEGLAEYKRFAFTPDGVSPRAIPGSGPKAVYLSTGNEHQEDGHLTEHPRIATLMLDKRMRKLEGARQEMRSPIREGCEEADITFVGWGSSYGPIQEAMSILNASGTRSANLVHFVDLWPFPIEEAQAALASTHRIVCVEGNGTGQFAELLHAQTEIRVDQRLLKYDGRGFTPDYILEHVED